MTVIDYRLVYRDGAIVDAPVSSFKLSDTQAELGSIPASQGDLAYSKDTKTFWVHTGSGFSSVVFYPLPTVGVWQNIPYSSSNFGASIGSWIVPSGNIFTFCYALIGKTCFISLFVSNTTLSNDSELRLLIPTGLYCPINWAGSVSIQMNGVDIPGIAYIIAGQNFINIRKVVNPITAGTITLALNISFPVA